MVKHQNNDPYIKYTMQLFFQILYSAKYIFLNNRLIYILLLSLSTPLVLTGCETKDPDKSVVLIVVFNTYTKKILGHGTGFVISNEGHIVTNHHVIDDTLRKRNLKLVALTEGEKSQKFILDVIWSSKTLDLAILRAPKLKAPPLTINTGELKKEDSVIAIGFPGIANAIDSRLDAWTISTRTKGEVSRLFKSDWNNVGRYIQSVQHTATINKGNSGGPLINKCGQVVGVNTFTTRIGQGTFFSSHASELAPILEAKNIPASITRSHCSNSGSPSYLWIVLISIFLSLLISLSVMLLYWPRARGFVSDVSRMVMPNQNHFQKDNIEPTLTHNFAAPKSSDFYLEDRETSRVYPLPSMQLKSTPLILGRSVSRGGIKIQGNSVSREHARMSCSLSDPITFFIEDLNSKNGTKVNGQAISPSNGLVKVMPGDVISLGQLNLHFSGLGQPNLNSQQKSNSDMLSALILKGSNRQTGQPISIRIDQNTINSKQNGIVIGRDEAYCDFIVSDPTVSAKGHAKITYSESGYAISDMNSTNGTKINHQKIQGGSHTPVLLQNDMIVHLGSLELRVEHK